MTVTPIRTTDEAVPEIFMIPCSQLVADDNIRTKLGDLSDLVASIKAKGVLEPLLVTWIEPPEGYKGEPGYRIAAGHRRHAAAVKAHGHAYAVPCVVKQWTEAERIEHMLIENMHRADLAPMDQARAFSRAISLGITKKALAKTLGVTDKLLTERLALLELPGEAAKLVDDGTITLEFAQILLRLKDHPAELVKIAVKGPRTEWAVRDRITELEREAQVKALEAEYKGKGREVVRHNDAIRPPKGLVWLEGMFAGKEATKHASLPCHRVVIVADRYSKPKVKTACSDPDGHLDPDAKLKTEPQQVADAKAHKARLSNISPEEQLAREERARIRHETEARHLDFLHQHLDKLTRTQQLELIVEAFVDHTYGTSTDDLVIAGVKLPVDASKHSELEEAMATYMARSSIARIKGAAAYALTALRPHSADQRLAWMESLGYELSEHEQAQRDADSAYARALAARIEAMGLTERVAKVRAGAEQAFGGGGFDEDLELQLGDNDDDEAAKASIEAMLDVYEKDIASATEADDGPRIVTHPDIATVRSEAEEELDDSDLPTDDDGDDGLDAEGLAYEGEGIESGRYDS